MQLTVLSVYAFLYGKAYLVSTVQFLACEVHFVQVITLDVYAIKIGLHSLAFPSKLRLLI